MKMTEKNSETGLTILESFNICNQYIHNRLANAAFPAANFN